MEEDNQDLSDFEEEDYETLYKNSQAAISRSQSNQYESKAMQDELLKYVENLDQMKGSDGTSLINVPSNFNSIVESMNRADLATTRSEEKPWSQYLLLDSLNSEFDTEYNGRYTQAFNDAPDVKIARGLAQIQLLDRQLAEAAKKATTVSTVDRIDHDEDGMDTEDPTFVTAGKRQTAAEPSSSNMKEKQRTRAIRKARSQPKDTTEEVQQRRRLELLTSDLEKDVDLQEKLGAYLDPELEQQDREVDARLEQFGRLGLLLQQQVDDGDDGRLEQEGAEEKGKMTEAGGLHHKDKVARHPADYLAQQRRERAERERAQRIDRLLEAVTSQVRYSTVIRCQHFCQ